MLKSFALSLLAAGLLFVASPAQASDSTTAQDLQSVEPAAGPSTDAGTTLPLTTDEARNATY